MAGNVKDRDYQEKAVAYMYGVSADQAKMMQTLLERGEMSQDDVARSCDYFALRNVPTGERQASFQSMTEKRKWVEFEYVLDPIDAIVKRDELIELEQRLAAMDVSNPKYQECCAAWYYGWKEDEAADKMYGLTEGQKADACDHFKTLWMSHKEMGETFLALEEQRKQIQKDFGLTPIEAIIKREELENAQFVTAVADLTVEGEKLEQ